MIFNDSLLDEYLYYDKDLYGHEVIDKNYDIQDTGFHIDDQFYNHVVHLYEYLNPAEYYLYGVDNSKLKQKFFSLMIDSTLRIL